MPRQRKRRPLVWDETKVNALNLVFEGRKSQAKIAEDCGVPTRTLEDWIAHPDFQAALQARRDTLIASLDHKPYIRKERRLIALAEMAEHARCEYEAHPLLTERRPIGRDADGEMLYMVHETFNRDAHAAFRESLNDIAKELGERTNTVNLMAQKNNLGITLILERMSGSTELTKHASDFINELAQAAAIPD